MRLAHPANARGLPHLNRTAAVLTQKLKEGQKPVQVPLLALEGFHRSCVRGITIYQKHKDHLQVGLDGEPAPRRQRRKLRTDAQHQLQYLIGNSRFRRHDMREFRVLQKKRREIFSAVAASLTTNEVGFEEQRSNRQRSRGFTLDTVVKRTDHNSEISLVERKKPVLNMTIGRARTQIQDLKVTVPIHSD